MWVQRVLLKSDRRPEPRSHHTVMDLQTGPPPEVLDEIDLAWERAQRPLDIVR